MKYLEFGKISIFIGEANVTQRVTSKTCFAATSAASFGSLLSPAGEVAKTFDYLFS
jgi:hypothetical protein